MLGRRLAASSTRPQLTAGWPALQQAGSSWSGYSSAAAAATASAASEPTTPEQLRQAFSYCVSQVKKHDYENYLWVTQLPKVGLVRRRACCAVLRPGRLSNAWRNVNRPPPLCHVHPTAAARRCYPTTTRRRSCAPPSLRCGHSTLRQG
jgi:hypothetical protein